MAMVTDDMIQNLMYNSLTIGVFGMIESKKKTIIKPVESVTDFQM
jgi:hypothetical protein